jgi:pimeloyl-ACP methyl ester carboxylesterase
MSPSLVPEGEPSGVAVVFVHGLFSSSSRTWAGMAGLVKGDETLPGIKTYLFNYDSAYRAGTFTQRTPSLDDVADNLFTFLNNRVEERDLVIVTHSQGGLVAIRLIERHFLNPAVDSTRFRPRYLVLYACPNSGSSFGMTVRRVFFRKHAQENSLRPLDPGTAESIRRVLVSANKPTEPLGDFDVVAIAGTLDRIVTPTSAKGFWPSVETVSGDHSTIVRPEVEDDDRYLVLRRRLREVLSSPAGPPPKASLSVGESFWSDLASEVARRLYFDYWDAAVGGLVRTSHAVPSRVLEGLHDFSAWLHGRIYPEGHDEIRRSLDTLHAVLIDLLNSFNRQTDLINPESDDSWVRVLRWHDSGGFNPRYDKDAADYDAHVELLADLTFELTRAAEWFCDVVREEIDPSYRLKEGALILEGGPFGDGNTQFIRVAYSEAERRLDPGPYTTLAKFRSTDRFTRDIHTVPPEGMSVANEEAGGDLADPEHVLINEQQARVESEIDVYRAWEVKWDRTSLIDALNLGAQSYLISKQGLRAPIWETQLHFRFRTNDAGDVLISIEKDDGEVLFDYIWTEGVSPIEVFRELDQAMVDLDEHLGPGLFLPTESIRTVVEALVFAASYRAQSLNQGSQYFQSIIEYVDGWFITERGLFPRAHPYYFIGIDRLAELDWEEHVASKGWDGIHAAMRVARALLGHAPL